MLNCRGSVISGATAAPVRSSPSTTRSEYLTGLIMCPARLRGAMTAGPIEAHPVPFCGPTARLFLKRLEAVLPSAFRCEEDCRRTAFAPLVMVAQRDAGRATIIGQGQR
jgi:hypothetical protein